MSLKNKFIGILLMFCASINVSNCMRRLSQLDKNSLEYKLNKAIEANNSELVSILISNGANLNDTIHKPLITAAHSACQFKNLEIFKLLIKSGADINIESKALFHSTDTLLIACHNGYLEFIKYLIEDLSMDINKNAKDILSHLIGFKSFRSDFSNDNSIEVLKYLISKNIDIKINKSFPFTYALSSINIDALYWLLESLPLKTKLLYIKLLDKKLQFGDHLGETLLHKAIKYGNIETIKHYMLPYIIDRKDNTGKTPIDLIFSINNPNIKSPLVDILSLFLKAAGNNN